MVEHPSDELISAYADNELEADARQAIASHLESCAVCRQRLSELDWARQRLATLRQESWRPEVSARVMSRITGPGRIWWLRRIATQVAAAASMALVLLVMGAAMVILLESRPQQQAEVPLSPDTAKALKERPEGKGELSGVSGLVYIADWGDVRWSNTPQLSFRILKPPQLLVFDPTRGEVVRRIPVGPSPDMVASPQGDRLYVTSFEAQGNDVVKYLKVLDASSSRELVRVEANSKTPVALSPDGRFLYLVHAEQIGDTTRNHLNVFDAQALQMLPYDIPSNSDVTLLDLVNKLLVSPDGKWLFALGVNWDSMDSGRVQFIDAEHRQIVDTVTAIEFTSKEPCGPYSFTGVLSPDGRYLYVINIAEQRVVVVDITSRSVVQAASFDVPQTSWGGEMLHALQELLVSPAWAKGCLDPASASVSPNGSRLYIGGYEELTYLGDGLWVLEWVLDTNTLQAIARITSSSVLRGKSLALSPDGRYLFALRYAQVTLAKNEYQLAMIDTASHRILAEFSDIGVSPTQIFVMTR